MKLKRRVTRSISDSLLCSWYKVKVVFVLNYFNETPDEELVIRSKAGDQNAFGIVFLRSKVEVYACIVNVVQNDEVAKDLWQDTYVKAWRHIQDLKDPSRFKFWLLTIAKHLAFDWRRKEDRERFSPLEESRSTSDPIDYEADPQVMIESARDADRVVSVLAQMEPVHRAILLLNANGFSRAEIAQKLGYKEGTVTTYLSLARKQFRQLYRIMDKTDDGGGKEQSNAQTHNALMPVSLDENDHSQESHSPNKNRKEI